MSEQVSLRIRRGARRLVPWAVAAVAVVLARPVDLTTAGVVAVLAGGVYTLVFADLQYLGVRRVKD